MHACHQPESGTFLKVMGNALQQRRHSDNAVNVPKNIHSTGSANASPSKATPLTAKAYSSSNLMSNAANRRRHSAVTTTDIQKFATKLMDSAAESVEKATSNVQRGIDNIRSPSPSTTSGRQSAGRRSVADIISDARASFSSQPAKPAKKTSKSSSSAKIFKKIGSEMVRCA